MELYSFKIVFCSIILFSERRLGAGAPRRFGKTEKQVCKFNLHWLSTIYQFSVYAHFRPQNQLEGEGRGPRRLELRPKPRGGFAARK